MKRKLSLIVLLVLMITIVSVKAATFTNYLPAGKNYFDINNLVVSSDSLVTVDSFRVKGDTVYTISMPGTDRIRTNTFFLIEGNIGGDYINEYAENDPACIVEFQELTCTFTTAVGEDFISVDIYSDEIGYYYNTYGLYRFQFEEGSVKTSYEEYIAPFVDSGSPEFSGAGAYIKSYQTFESLSSIIDNHIIVIDDVDGDITNSVVIVVDEYTTNEQVVGEYLVRLSASDLSGNTALFDLTIIVKDEVNPTINGPSNVTISISEETNINQIIANHFLIEDEYSSTVMSVLSDSYSVNKDILGTYSVTFEVTDESLNSVERQFNVNLVDIDVPSLVTNPNFNSYLSSPIDTAYISNALVYSDNYDDMSLYTPTIITNEFIGNENIPGTYLIVFDISDSSGNILRNNINVTVIDDILPVLSGPVTYVGSYTEELTIDDFKDMLSVSDNIDLLTINNIYVISDNYTNRTGIIGDFEIVFGVVDSNSNEVIHSISINVFDDIAPVIYIDNFIVTVTLESTFTPEDALLLLINSEELIDDYYEVSTIIDEYSGNEENVGTYTLKLEFKNSQGETYEKDFLVKVIDEDDSIFDENLLLRNIIVYLGSFGIFVFIVLKNKK